MNATTIKELIERKMLWTDLSPAEKSESVQNFDIRIKSLVKIWTSKETCGLKAGKIKAREFFSLYEVDYVPLETWAEAGELACESFRDTISKRVDPCPDYSIAELLTELGEKADDPHESGSINAVLYIKDLCRTYNFRYQGHKDWKSVANGLSVIMMDILDRGRTDSISVKGLKELGEFCDDRYEYTRHSKIPTLKRYALRQGYSSKEIDSFKTWSDLASSLKVDANNRKALGKYAKCKQTLKKEKCNMTNLQKLQEANKDAAVTAVRQEAGKIAVNNISEFLKAAVPEEFHPFLDNPAFVLAVANGAKLALDATMGDDKRASVLGDVMLEGAMAQFFASFKVEELFDKLVKGVDMEALQRTTKVND